MGAAVAAGCKMALIGTGDFGQDITVGSLEEFADFLLDDRKRSCDMNG